MTILAEIIIASTIVVFTFGAIGAKIATSTSDACDACDAESVSDMIMISSPPPELLNYDADCEADCESCEADACDASDCSLESVVL